MEILMSCLKRWWLFVICAIIGGLLAFCYTGFLVTPVYDSVGTLIVNNSQTNTSGTMDQSDIFTSQQLVETYAVVLGSDRYLNIVADEVNLGYTAQQIKGMLSISGVNNTEVMRVIVRNTNPEHAALIAQAVLDNAKEEIIRVVEVGSVKVIDNASIPQFPSSPNVPRSVLLGILLGIIVAAVIVFVGEMLDNTVKDEQDLTKRFDLPILGSIPTFGEE